MLAQIIPPVLMILSIAIIVFLIGRKVPDSIKKINKSTSDSEDPNKKIDSREFKEKMANFLEKTLRRIKIFILKTDARLMQLIKNLQKRKDERNEAQAKKLPFKEDFEEKKPTIVSPQEKIDKLVESLPKTKTIEERKKEEEQENLEKEAEKLLEEEKRKKPILKRMTEIREKLMKNNEKPKKKKKKKKKKQQDKKKKTKETKKEKEKRRRVINLAETRRVMIEREEEALIKRIAANPKDDQSYVGLGRLYLKIENFSDAKASFEQALKINRGNIHAKKFLKEIAQKGY
jgi:tetratricopeptide (TPR) repeat protein